MDHLDTCFRYLSFGGETGRTASELDNYLGSYFSDNDKKVALDIIKGHVNVIEVNGYFVVKTCLFQRYALDNRAVPSI